MSSRAPASACWPAVMFAVLGLLAAAGCRRAAPDVPPAASALGTLQVLKDGRYLFTYLEPNGTFATTDKPEIIPETARKMVRVVDPAQTKTAEAVDVFTVDVDQLLKGQKAEARPMSR